ncbi:hypothetical protein ACE38W_12315 [Chitinophaga sp. Hz27]|uniref:hypothetical protein n=1 Tax=Chitinophaga sp. Hz27 TaxID=3347169 RepID=UPI0035D9410B
MKKIIAILVATLLLNACNSGGRGNTLNGKKLYTLVVGKGDNPFIFESEMDFLSDKAVSIQHVLATSPKYFQTQDNGVMKGLYNKIDYSYTWEQSVLTLVRSQQTTLISKLTPIGDGMYEGTERDHYYTTSILGHFDAPSTRERVIRAYKDLNLDEPTAAEVDILMNLLTGQRNADGDLIQ